MDGALVVGIGMTATTYFTSVSQAAPHARGDLRIAGTAVAFIPHRHNQDDPDEVAREFTEFAGPGLMLFAQTAGVDHRSLALPLSGYPKMTGSVKRATPKENSRKRESHSRTAIQPLPRRARRLRNRTDKD